jgi:chromosomal replication initiator protein
LKDSAESLAPSKPREIIQMVCKRFDLDPIALKTKNNSARIAIVRHTIQYILREVLGWSYPEIAAHTGVSHHTTVMHGIDRIEKMRKANPEFDDKIRRLISKAIGDDEQPTAEPMLELTQ